MARSSSHTPLSILDRGYNTNKPSTFSRLVSIAGGESQVFAGGLACTTVTGCLFGAPLITHGYNNIYEGVTGRDGPLRQGYQSVFGKDYGDVAYGVVDVGLSGGALLTKAPKPDSWKLFKNVPGDYVKKYQTMGKIPIAGETLININSIQDTYGRVDGP
ncbi:MAG: DUF4225 domain-containing protein [Gammaproteobacteria bacterium]|nr:DUF4225 domain-containing protein [Gammaproteobacteria bacterium]